jgi:hypothetical protein
MPDAPVAPGILGEAIFVTHDGLTAEGSGALVAIADNVSLVEFRDATNGIDHLPPRGSFAFTATWIAIDGAEAMLLGAVMRERDAMKRPGFFGICRAVPPREFHDRDYEELIARFREGYAFHRDRYSKTRHSDEIGFLEHHPGRGPDLRALTDVGATAVYVRGDDAEDEAEAAHRLWQMVRETGRPALLWNVPDGPHPVLDDAAVDREIDRSRAAPDRVQDTGKRRQDMAHRMSTPPPDMGHSAERRARFEQRTRHLAHPRPRSITVEQEDYLIGLIQFVTAQSGPPAGRSAAPPPASAPASPPFGAGTDVFSRHPSRRRLADAASMPLLLAAGFALIVLLVAILAVTTMRDADGAPSAPAPAVVAPQSPAPVPDPPPGSSPPPD